MLNRFKQLGIPILIIAIGIAVYSNSLDCAFHLDDESITKNALITDASYIPELIKDEPQRFVAYLTFMGNYYLGGLDVKGYHLVNIMIHIFNALLVFLLMTQFVAINKGRGQAPNGGSLQNCFHWVPVPLLVALIFLTHPVQTQAVTYIVQRLASLATLFYLLSLNCYLKLRMEQKVGQKAGDCPRMGTVPFGKLFVGGIGLISFGLGMFTKEIIYTLPLMILAIEWMFFRHKGSKATALPPVVRWMAIGGVILAVWVLIRFDVAKILAPKVTPDFVTVTSAQYLMTQFKVMWMYARVLILPVGLNVDHQVAIAQTLWEPRVIGSLAGLITLFVATAWLSKRNRLAAFGVVWMAIALLIESSIVPLEDVMFEHRLYLPMVGFALFVVSIVSRGTGCRVLSAEKNSGNSSEQRTTNNEQQRTVKKNKMILSLLCLIVSIFAVMSYQRNAVWKTGITLWSDAVRKSPNKARPYFNLGNAYKRNDDFRAAIDYYDRSIELAPRYAEAFHARGIAHRSLGTLQTALDDFNRAINVEPLKVDYRLNRAETLRRMGMTDEAVTEYGRIIQMAPNTVEAYIDRGTILYTMNKLDQAIDDFNRAEAINPKNPLIYNNRALSYMKTGNKDKALNDLNKAAGLNINNPLSYYTRGTIYREQGEYEKALNDFTRAIALKPDYFEAYNDRGIVLAQLKRFEAAIGDFNKTLSINPSFADAYRNRGIVYGRAGDVEQAESDLKKAREMMFKNIQLPPEVKAQMK